MDITVNEKLTAIADEVREISGTTDELSLDDMANKVSDANDVIVNQNIIIGQINSAFEGVAGNKATITVKNPSNITCNLLYNSSNGVVFSSLIDNTSIDDVYIDSLIAFIYASNTVTGITGDANFRAWVSSSAIKLAEIYGDTTITIS